MGSGEVVFVLSALFAIGGAVGTVVPRNPLRAAVALLVHVISLAGLYLTLHAHLLAALQLLVYAGAVVVLFVFVIMMIGPDSAPALRDAHGLVVRTFSFALMLLVAGLVAFTVVDVDLGVAPALAPCPPEAGAECGQFGGVKAFGRDLYRGAAVPFEIVSALLLIGVVGAVAVARGRTAREQAVADRRKAAAAEGG